MKNKQSAAVVLIVIILFFSCSLGFAEKDTKKWRDQADHIRWTNAMIFGNESYQYAKPKEIRNTIELIHNALLLCLDQYNGSYKDKLQHLRDAGIKDLPADISSIDFTASTTHRKYTHRGWYYDYNKSEISKGHADIRKKIMKTTIDQIFHFGDYVSSDDAKDKKCDAMCCLLYVTHIIADRYHSSIHYGASSTQLLAEDTQSAIYDLEQCLPTLITEGDSSSLIRKLNEISAEMLRKRRSMTTTTNMSEKLLELDREYAPKVKNLLKENLYNLLIKQTWFNDVFSSEWSSNE